MNEQVKAEWVAALRSGKYEQGSGVLRTRIADGPDKFCCIGVLLDCQIHATGGHWVANTADSMDFVFPPKLSRTNEAMRFQLNRDPHMYPSSAEPQEDPDTFGLSKDWENHFIRMNDNKLTPYSFDDIANAIEANA
jgi:hypothetical protein